MNNSLHVIYPKRRGSVWSFSDPAVGLVNEPFVGDTNRIIDRLVLFATEAREGDYELALTFSSSAFPNAVKLQWTKAEHGGNWYAWKDQHLTGWLCPALLKYFPTAPRSIFVRTDAAKLP